MTTWPVYYYKIFYKKCDAILSIDNNNVYFLKKCINLNNASITFGKYGLPAAGSYGSILYISDSVQQIKIAIPDYTASNANYYTKDWSMRADCFIDKNDMETLFPIIEKKRRIEAVEINTFSDNEIVFELRGNIKAGKMILLLYAFMLIPIAIAVAFNISNRFISPLLIIIALGSFFYYIIQKSRKGIGFYLILKNGMARFLHLGSKKEIFNTFISTIDTDVYIGKLSTKGGTFYYLIIKLKIPEFKNITIGQMGSWGGNAWKGKNLAIKKSMWKNENLKTKSLFFSSPDYIIDATSWQKLAHIFGIDIS